MIEEYEQNGETILPALKKNGLILRAGFFKRALIDFVMSLQNHGRAVTQIRCLKPMQPLDFE